MTLLELINLQIKKTPNTELIESVRQNALEEAFPVLKKVLDKNIINEWIASGLLDYSRKNKRRLTTLFQMLELSVAEQVLLLQKYEEGKNSISVKPYNENMPNIHTEVITFTASDGKALKGILVWSAKDFNLYLKEPFDIYCGGAHLMYAIPVKYVLGENQVDSKNGVKCVPLLERAKGMLLEKYETYLQNQT